MKKSALILVLIAFFCGSKCVSQTESNLPIKTTIDTEIEKKLSSHANKVKVLVTKNQKYNNEIGFFIDMKIQSGKNRFFVYDLKENKIIDQGLVAHGWGSETGFEGKLKFSNVNNSYCTSLGNYSVDVSYNGIFGKAYRLYGLNKTNSNAYNRAIVLHKYSKVPYNEQAEAICNSLGCPMVNEIFFKRIESIIDNSKKNIILEIYY